MREAVEEFLEEHMCVGIREVQPDTFGASISKI
jgi:hypothetical protein